MFVNYFNFVFFVLERCNRIDAFKIASPYKPGSEIDLALNCIILLFLLFISWSQHDNIDIVCIFFVRFFLKKNSCLK